MQSLTNERSRQNQLIMSLHQQVAARGHKSRDGQRKRYHERPPLTIARATNSPGKVLEIREMVSVSPKVFNSTVISA